MSSTHRDGSRLARLSGALGLAFLVLAGPSRADWEISGEAGGELDSIGEEFGSGVSIDDQIDPTDPLDDLAGDIRFEDRTTESSAVLALRVREETRLFDGSFRLKTRPDKSRAEVDLRGGFGSALGAWRWSDRIYSEFAGTDADGGWLHLAQIGWDSPRKVAGAGIELRANHELSRAGEDSLASLFDYQLFRPGLAIGGRLGSFGLALESGTQHKRVIDDGNGSYDGSWLELRSSGRGLSLTGRLESRGYARRDSLTPSFQEISFRSDWYRSIAGRHDARVELGIRTLQYALDSSIFRDHLEWETGIHWRTELGGEESAGSGFPARSTAAGATLADGPSVGSDSDPGEVLRRLDRALADLAYLEAELTPDSVPDSAGSELSDPEVVTAEPESLPDARGRASIPESLGPHAPLPSLGRWFLEFGVLGSGNVGESDDSGDYSQGSGRLTFGRQADDRFWLDLSLEVGRRDYLRDTRSTDLVFEGFDFSVSGSDYLFFEVSALGEFGLPAGLSFDLFAQYEDQRHDESADDFRLWILTASLVRKF